jgi:hypothetical protein
MRLVQELFTRAKPFTEYKSSMEVYEAVVGTHLVPENPIQTPSRESRTWTDTYLTRTTAHTPPHTHHRTRVIAHAPPHTRTSQARIRGRHSRRTYPMRWPPCWRIVGRGIG